ncbi:hypothetical protein Phum_PHUM168470 [Pediculus humanus corporis]|uniref:Tetraspanin n=1 Tax=Pediculus humanus subsp. corporis TaxID=121224 RepID=E0VFW9_PEDHC|nr:uncharacterized protein Phum_PHUM168470 [Pediculus humanus corporis]EEB12275.1 hypothetical protein Phum_PHUM168470 [Pediculus humanus corporis]
MNYYRIWIYTCNAVLFVSVLGFIIVAGKVVLVDPRSGLLQLLGCIGAHKLNEKLLNTYWFLLLFLLFGDAFIGVVWIFRFDKIYTDIRPILRQRLQMEYGINQEFTELWDTIQNDLRCCGVEGPQDFNEIDLSKRKSITIGNDTEDLQKTNSFVDESLNRLPENKLLEKSANFLVESTKYYTTDITGLDDNFTDDPNNFYLTTASASNELTTTTTTTKDSNAKQVRHVPESCCRLITEEEPDKNTEEKQKEPQSKPTAIRQRLEKKKNRQQENITSKRSLTTPVPDDICNSSKNCKTWNKRHAKENIRQFRSSHLRQNEIVNKTPHHFSISTNFVTQSEKQNKNFIQFINNNNNNNNNNSTGSNIDIMNTCANINGHSIGTVYGISKTLHFSVGCEVKLKEWMRDSAHLLGVLGYCVIAFLKLCFLGILKYEIREMIQKIKLLQGELQPPILLLSMDSPDENPESQSPQSPHNLCNHMDNAIHLGNPNKSQTNLSTDIPAKEKPDRMRANSLGNALLLLQPHESSQTTPAHQKKIKHMSLQNQRLFSSTPGGDTGNESDTNSHCALLIDGDDASPKKKHSRMSSSNGNNNYECHELQDLLVKRSAQI